MMWPLWDLIAKKRNLVLADQMVYSGSGFVTTIVLARILGPADFGIYSTLVLISYLMLSILNAIIIQPLQVAKSDISEHALYPAFTFWAQTLLVLLICGLVWLLLGLQLGDLGAFNSLGKNQVVYYVGFLMNDYFRKLLLARSQVKSILIIDTFTAGLQIIFLILLGIGYLVWPLKWIVLTMGLSYIPGVLWGIPLIRSLLHLFTSWGPFIKFHYNTGRWLLLTSVTQWWSGNLFFAVTGVFLGAQALGAFRLIQSILGVLNIVLQTFENYVLPKATRLYQKSKLEAYVYIKDTSKKAMLIFGVTLVVIYIFAHLIIRLAGGEEYLTYAPALRGMTILYAVICISSPFRISIRMLLLHRSYFMGYLFSLVFSLLSFNYLLQRWQITGAILGLISAQCIALVYWLYILVKNGQIWWRRTP